MIIAELDQGYYIEIDPLNYTLKQRFTGKTKTGEIKESVRICGYYGDIREAVRRFVELVRLDSMDGMVISLREYIEALERHEKAVIERIDKMFGGYPVK